MNDPKEQPGYQFAAIRLVRADYRLTGGPPPGVKGNMDVDYADRVDIQGENVRVTQILKVRIVSPAPPIEPYLELLIEVQGDFVASPGANITPADFGNNHAPAILFPFSREWVHRLTSASSPWPPIMLPPLNVIQLRTRNLPKGKQST